MTYTSSITYIPLLAENIFFIQGIGLLAFFVMAISFQSNIRVHILYMQVLGMGLLGIHLWLLSALTGVAMMATLMARNLIFAQKDRHPWAGHRYVYYLALMGVVVAGLLSWQGWGSIFAIAGSFAATYGFWLTDTKRVRIVILISAFVWAPYGIIFKSYPMLLLQLFLVTSILIAMWRYDRPGKTEDV